jgi:threonine dehydrogenase-like Zn-dependent dehydrogenase
MQALTFHGKENIHYESVADPTIVENTDAIIKVQGCAICGSDLHVYHEHEKGCDHGAVMGHEFVGEIVEVGKNTTQFSPGDLVMSPFTTSCGQCFYCLMGLTCRCTKGQLFGWREQQQGLHGGQAEYVRVPLADQTLVKIPSGMDLEVALLLGDILSTGYFCAHQAMIKPDQVQVVVGCGPVGLMAIWSARKLGAQQLYAVDMAPERLAKAKAWGAIPIDSSTTDPLEVIRAATQGRGADSVLEAVGNHSANRLAINLLRPGGTLSAVGVCTDTHMAFSPVEAYNKNLTYKVGRCPARYYMDRLVDMAQEDAAQLTTVFSHRLPLSAGREAYRIFAEKKEGCTKVLLKPGS